jgi:hypothetical protein
MEIIPFETVEMKNIKFITNLLIKMIGRYRGYNKYIKKHIIILKDKVENIDSCKELKNIRSYVRLIKMERIKFNKVFLVGTLKKETNHSPLKKITESGILKLIYDFIGIKTDTELTIYEKTYMDSHKIKQLNKYPLSYRESIEYLRNSKSDWWHNNEYINKTNNDIFRSYIKRRIPDESNE